MEPGQPQKTHFRIRALCLGSVALYKETQKEKAKKVKGSPGLPRNARKGTLGLVTLKGGAQNQKKNVKGTPGLPRHARHRAGPLAVLPSGYRV